MSDSHERGFTWPLVLFAVVVISVLFAVVAQPFFFSRRGPSHRSNGLHNAKSIASALHIFRIDKVSYPDQRTHQMLVEEGFDNLPQGDHANAYLAQLIVTDF